MGRNSPVPKDKQVYPDQDVKDDRETEMRIMRRKDRAGKKR